MTNPSEILHRERQYDCCALCKISAGFVTPDKRDRQMIYQFKANFGQIVFHCYGPLAMDCDAMNVGVEDTSIYGSLTWSHVNNVTQQPM